MPTTEARERAAQLWCLPQFSNREMDAEFAEAIAEALTEFRNAGIEAAADKAHEVYVRWDERSRRLDSNREACEMRSLGAVDAEEKIRALKRGE